MANTTTNKWAVVNKKTGKIVYTRASNYHRKAEFGTRTAARTAITAGEVSRNTKDLAVRKVLFDGTIVAL